MKGKLIVIAGTDGSGKTEQTENLVNRLTYEKYSVETISFPQHGERSATLVDDYLTGEYGTAKEVGPYRASIFFACDRYVAFILKMREWLKQGKIIISNRYVSANMGHQAGKIKNKKERDKFLEWLENFEFNIFGIPKPNKNIFLYMPPEIGQKFVEKKKSRNYLTGKKMDIHEADLKHLKEATKAYLYVAKKYNWDIINCAPNNKVRTIDDISQELWEKVKPLIK